MITMKENETAAEENMKYMKGHEASPLVSVIIPTRNGMNTLAHALDSIIAQTYKNIEIIVVIDHKNDSSAPESERSAYDQIEKIIKNTSSKYPQLIHPIKIVPGSCRGPGIARNTGAKEAQGTWLAFLDDDDRWSTSTKLEKQIEVVQKRPETLLVGVAKAHFIDENGNTISYINQPIDPVSVHNQMIIRNPIFTSGAMIYKAVFDRMGGFSKKYLAEDYELWLKVGSSSKTYTIENAPDTEIEYTVRQNSLSRSRALHMAWNVFMLVLRFSLRYRNSIPQLIKAKSKVVLRLLKQLRTQYFK